MNVPENMTLQATIDQSEVKPTTGVLLAEWFSWPGRIAVLIAVLLSPWMFGSYGPSAQRLIMFCLLIGIAFWWFESAVRRNRTQVMPYIAVPLMLGLLIGFMQTLALPDWLADLLVGRQAELYKQFVPGDEVPVRISMDVESTLGQIRLMVICLSALLLGCRYFRSTRDMVILLAACTINGSLIAFFGLVHKLTAASGTIFWTIELSAGGAPFGPFVNKNNCSGYLLLCLACALGLCALVMSERKTSGPVQMVSKEMPFWRQFNFHLLFFIAELTATKIAVLISIVLIASGIVGTVSKGGVAALFIGSMVTLGLYGVARRPKYSGFILLPLVGFVFALTGWLNFSGQLIRRFENVDIVNFSNEGRLDTWTDTWPSVEQMGWFGSGLGSYSSVHRLYRSGKENVIYEYAENQFFQGLVEAGWPGLILFCLAWWLLYRYSSQCLFKGVSPSTIAVGVTGVFLVSSQIPASIVDFGLYMPANAILLATLTGFIAFHAHSFSGRLKRASWLRFQAPNSLVQAALLIVFAIGVICLLQFHRDARQANAMDVRYEDLLDRKQDLERTDRMIKNVTEVSKNAPSSKAMNYLGRLWVHRARLQFFESIQQEPDYQSALALKTDEEKKIIEDNMWKLTSLPWMQENAYMLNRDYSSFRARRFLNSEFIRQNLPAARGYFDYSRRRRPLQPLAHLEVGKISGILQQGQGVGDADIERAIALAPANADYRETAATYYLQSGRVDEATVHLQELLRLEPRLLKRTLNLLAGRTSRTVVKVDEAAVFQQVIPDNPAMLYSYAKDYLDSDSEVRAMVLEKADLLAGNPAAGDLKMAKLKAQIKLLMGDVESSIDFLKLVLVSRPDDVKSRFSLAKLLQKVGRLDESMEEVDYLLRVQPSNRWYNNLGKELREELRQRENPRRTRFK
ncbi:O-antigen ligase family protein [Mariniblastus sp.]|nr:O-antigen ligase family protein [Mariniblastus sp.]